jgi:hypothetical protein
MDVVGFIGLAVAAGLPLMLAAANVLLAWSIAQLVGQNAVGVVLVAPPGPPDTSDDSDTDSDSDFNADPVCDHPVVPNALSQTKYTISCSQS